MEMMACLALTVDEDGEKGDEVADEGDACDGQKNVSQRQDDRVGLNDKIARHLYESELLLKE